MLHKKCPVAIYFQLPTDPSRYMLWLNENRPSIVNLVRNEWVICFGEILLEIHQFFTVKIGQPPNFPGMIFWEMLSRNGLCHDYTEFFECGCVFYF